MAISFIGENGTAANNPTSASWDLGAISWSAGDLAIAWWWTFDDTKTVTEPAGITQKYDSSSTGFGRLFIGYRYLVGGDTTFAWTSSSVADSTTCYGLSVYRGTFGSGDPWNAESGAPQTFTNENDPDPPAVTVATDQSAVVVIWGKRNDITSGSPSTNYTDGGTETSNVGNDASGGVEYRLGLSTGSEDPGVITLGGGAVGDDGYIWTAAMHPAVSASTWPGWAGGGWW